MFWLNCWRPMVSKLYRWLRLPPQDGYHIVLHVRDAERYLIILEALDNAVLENQNAKWIHYRSTLLEEKQFSKSAFWKMFSVSPMFSVWYCRQTRNILLLSQELFQTASRYLKKFRLTRMLICLKVSTPCVLI